MRDDDAPLVGPSIAEECHPVTYANVTTGRMDMGRCFTDHQQTWRRDGSDGELSEYDHRLTVAQGKSLQQEVSTRPGGSGPRRPPGKRLPSP